MANITKPVTRGPMEINKRDGLYWDTTVDTNDDGDAIANSDIFRLEDSLRHPAAEIMITTVAAPLTIRLNPVKRTAPARPQTEGWMIDYPYLAQMAEWIDTGGPTITISANSVWVHSGPISTIQIVTKTGDFKLEVL